MTVPRHLTRVIFAALTIALVAPAVRAQPATSPATAPSTQPSQAAVIVLGGVIDNFNRDTLFKRFEQARAIGADTVILQIDTYGGLVTAGLDISRYIKRQDDLHVIAFVDEKAISAGAMIALACDEIVMAPGALLGDCAPIALNTTGDLEPMPATERAKAESPILEDFYDSAVRNGYDPMLAQAMVSVGRVIHWMENESTGDKRFVDADGYQKLKAEGGWKPVDGARDPIDAGDTLLTVSTELATKLGFARGTASSAEDLARQRGYSVIATLAPGGGEQFIALLSSTTVRAILTTIFMLALYMAFSHPGHGMAEVAAVVALSVLVGVPLLTGYAQWWEIVAILVGLALLAVEIFIIPGFGITGFTGIALILFGLVMTFVGDEPVELPGVLPSLAGTWAALRKGLIVVVTGMACSLILWLWLQRYLPRLPYVNRLILTATVGGNATIADTGIPGAVEVVPWPAVGAVGEAVTDLKPGGAAEFRDDTIDDNRVTDVVSESGFLVKGARVVVREVRGNRIVVRAV